MRQPSAACELCAGKILLLDDRLGCFLDGVGCATYKLLPNMF